MEFGGRCVQASDADRDRQEDRSGVTGVGGGKKKRRGRGKAAVVVENDEDDDRACLDELLRQVSRLNAPQQAAPLEQPRAVVNCALKQHQLAALGWLASLHSHGLGGILGDEAGLGKTLTAISFLCHLMKEEEENHNPFLVVAPLSVIKQWHNEFAKYAPSVKTLLYVGKKEEREALRAKFKKGDASVEFGVLITTPETLLADAKFLKRHAWRMVVVDEAHRLKNPRSVFYATFLEFRITNKLLMTSTPLHDSPQELWALMHLVAPHVFNDRDLFDRWFKSLTPPKQGGNQGVEAAAADTESMMSKLQELIRPFLLRRRLNSVDLELPPKREQTVHADLSPMQKKFYRWILSHDVDALTKNTSGTSATAMLANTMVSLRKCCNHPYLFGGAEPQFDGQYVTGEHIIENSGKLAALDGLLAKLHEDGHKVLLFSQMTRMLDILEDYLLFRGYDYKRLGGSVRGEEAAGEPEVCPFVHLLATRAGGRGLNLTVADTVIFFDTDWNLLCDMRAQARAYAIGQTKEVTVIRLVARATVEEHILERAQRKLTFGSAVLQEDDDNDDDGDHHDENEVERLLRQGATGSVFEKASFTQTEDDATSINGAAFWASFLPQAETDTKRF